MPATFPALSSQDLQHKAARRQRFGIQGGHARKLNRPSDNFVRSTPTARPAWRRSPWGKVNLDIIWLRDDSLTDSDNLPSPEIIAREIVEDLQAALTEFAAIADALEAGAGLSMQDRPA